MRDPCPKKQHLPQPKNHKFIYIVRRLRQPVLALHRKAKPQNESHGGLVAPILITSAGEAHITGRTVTAFLLMTNLLRPVSL